MEQIHAGVTLRHIEDREMIWDSQQSFTKDKSHQTNIVAFYDGATA